MKIDEHSAIVIAQKFVHDKGWEVGKVSKVKHLAREDYPERVRPFANHGRWLVCFGHGSQPLKGKEPGLIPSGDDLTGVLVDDETGVAEVVTPL